MKIDDFILLGQFSLETAVLTSAPILGLGLIAGLFVSVLQAATQINDASLAFIPKIAAVIVGLALFGHFMMNRIAFFTAYVFEKIGTITPN